MSHPTQDEPDTDSENEATIDPNLRLRTVRTAASAIAESILSEQRRETRLSKRKRSRFFGGSTKGRGEKKHKERERERERAEREQKEKEARENLEVPGERRNVYVNLPLAPAELDQKGEPKARYVRNKVRTTKYTILTFVPKNLFEQFRRLANLFFLSLVILTLSSPIFGAASGSTAVLPLAFIIVVTAIKDGIEDYRRSIIDEEVNTSASTRLGGGWRNVNQPLDPREWWERLVGVRKPGKVTKGVRKLREREGREGMGEVGSAGVMGAAAAGRTEEAFEESTLDLTRKNGRLEDIQSIDSHSYPPGASSSVDLTRSISNPSSNTISPPAPPPLPLPGTTSKPQWSQFSSLSQYQQSLHSQSTLGVIDPSRHAGLASWERTLWKKLEVGDIVLLHENDQVPADIVVLATSDPDGMCYLETKNLDGETNLKPRKACKATSAMEREEDVARASFVLDSEPPHQNLYLYHGVLRYVDPATSEKKQEPVTISELLLRGCALRNTAWVIGLVVFTGADTKIMLNGGDTPSKRSKIEKETNFNVAVNFGVLTIMCLVAAIFNGIQDGQTGTSADFFEKGSEASGSSVVNAIVTFVSCLIAFQNIVPISLYISIEIVKTIQAYFISQDIEMYYSPLDTPCVPKTWNISDDLGQIEYVFSDKTGTLTQNVMEFQKCSVNGVTYGEGVTEAMRGAAMREGGGKEGDLAMDSEELNAKLAELKDQMVATMNGSFKNRYRKLSKLTLVSPKLAQDLADRSAAQRGHLIAFFRALALCHSVLADKPNARAEPYNLEYKAESPDEAALVAAARDVGFPFVGKGKDGIDIEVMGQQERYTPLQLLEFNSTRKRMSVILRCPDGRLILYCKGADSVIYQRLAATHDPVLKEQTAKDMEAFANNGLRTLCIAYRYLEEEEYLSWGRVYDEAVNKIEGRDEAIEGANELIERDLVILGATALEDKLQEGVPEAIEMLHRAGIKLWILTGDKLQTAIEIGYSCNLLKNDMDLMILSADSAESARAQIEAGLNKIASVLGPPSWDSRNRGFVPGAQASFAVVIDGDTLTHALTPELKPLFLNLGTQCETVVCCRVSPAQKALTVNLVKEGRNAMTLSIGDGANDVAMIQEANIGCGLFGLEGSQAAMSADYAFGQFRFLTKLLLVHGRWSYQRVAEMHGNFFYKNAMWTLAMFWYLPFNSFDATYLYQYTFILLYNLVFTSLPVIILGAFDQDINAKAAIAFPQLYIRGIRGLEYTRSKFWWYMGDGLYQSAVVFFIPYLVWNLGLATSWNGRGIDSLADFGTTVSVAAIVSANTYVGLNTNYWTIMTWIVVIGSSLVMMLWIVIYSYWFSSDFIDEFTILFGTMNFWATVVLSAAIALGPRFIVKFVSNVYHPLDKDIVREMWVLGDLKDQLGLQHRHAKKNIKDVVSPYEATPMFQNPHSRSHSEISLQNAYEPVAVATPPSSDKLRQTYPDNRLESADMRSPYLDASPSPQHLSPFSAQAQRNSNRISVVSPQPSYYSASEIPPPSPLPSPKYRYPSGEVTSTPPPRSRSGSIVTRNTSRGGPSSQPQPSSPPLQPRSPNSRLQVPSPQLVRRLSGGAGASSSHDDPGAYEMRVRSPPLEHPPGLHAPAPAPHPPGFDRADSKASMTSYGTAMDDYYTAEDDNGGGGHDDVQHSVNPDLLHPTHHPGYSEDYSDAYDGATIREHDHRRASAVTQDSTTTSDWGGGIAL